ncbi:MAG: NinE family protein [Enterobacterales bacterium]|nr:NinE family protein [Enterobacterales bacterium]
MNRQRSPTQIAIDNLIFNKSTPRSKPQPISTVTFNYSAHLHDVRWLRVRARNRHD